LPVREKIPPGRISDRFQFDPSQHFLRRKDHDFVATDREVVRPAGHGFLPEIYPIVTQLPDTDPLAGVFEWVGEREVSVTELIGRF
jgi:hypothetical protein